jgi:hypothetical protein
VFDRREFFSFSGQKVFLATSFYSLPDETIGARNFLFLFYQEKRKDEKCSYSTVSVGHDELQIKKDFKSA